MVSQLFPGDILCDRPILTMVNKGEQQTWAVQCGPILLTWCRRQYGLKKQAEHLSETSNMPSSRFIEEVIESHNDYRRIHQAPPLTHSPRLSDIAQSWAEELARTNSFQHSQSKQEGQPLGENISLKWSSRAETYSGKDVSDQWYSEVKMYQFGSEPRSTNCGHFTQMVWRDSREIGVGKAQASDGKIVVVANYKPAGNYLGRFSENVFPSKGGVIPSSHTNRDTNRNYGYGDRHSPSTSRFGSRENMDGPRNDTSQSRSVKTYTTTEGSGPNAVTKTIVEETVTMPDGRKVTTKKETVTNGRSGGSSSGGGFGSLMGRGFGDFEHNFSSRFERLGFGDNNGFSSNQGIKSTSPTNGGTERKQSPPQTMSQFSKDCLSSHNEKRKLHGVPPLTQSRDLTDHAQKWAEHIASTGQFGHSNCTLRNGDRIGENIACKWSSGGDDYSGGQATEQWYSEIKKMDFRRVNQSAGTGHFTQVVWKGSREFGVGKARGRDGKVFVVANYRPAGNMMGDYENNVFPPKY